MFSMVESAMFTVTNTNDSGIGSLRQAILNANADTSKLRTINFSIETGVQTIQPLSALPPITVSKTIIDGTTQPGWAVGNPVIIIDGSLIPTSTVETGVLTVSGADLCIIGSLIINGANKPQQNGVLITNNDSAGANKNVVIGCFIGTDQTGIVAVPNQNGVLISADSSTLSNNNNMIGGLLASQRNVISGNTNAGVVLLNNVNSTVIQGNYIGINQVGLPLPNNVGIYCAGTSFPVGGTVIGGPKTRSINVISANNLQGIYFEDDVINSTIQGNFIGTDSSATLNLGNGANGILIQGSLDAPCTNNLIGGVNTGEGNVIAYNGNGDTQNYGVFLDGNASTPDILNAILGNSIYANNNNGIQLSNNSNDGQLPPTLIEATLNENILTIIARTPNIPDSTYYRLEFFVTATNRNQITEGQLFIGALSSVAADTVVTQSFVVPSGVIVGQWISATATNLNNVDGTPGDTSMFSQNLQIQEPAQHLMDKPTTLTAVTVQLKALPGVVSKGESTTLSVQMTGQAPFILQWSDGYIQISPDSVATRVIQPMGTFSYFVNVLDANGTQKKSNDFYVRVMQNSESITARLTAYPILINEGESSELLVQMIGQPPFTLTWSDGFVQTSNNAIVVRAVNPTTTTSYSVKIIDGSGIKETSNNFYVNVNQNVVDDQETILPVTAELSAFPAIISEGDSSTLQLALVGQPPFTLRWSDGFEQTATDLMATRLVRPTSTTQYFVEIADARGTQATSNDFTVHVKS